MTYTYPLPPENAPDGIVKPSARFKKEVRKVVAALIFFGLLYLLLLAFSIALAVAFCMAGFWIVVSVHNFWAIIFGVGLAGIGLMVVFFIIKFLFAEKKEDNTDRVEITEQEYPDLFAFIRAVSEETNTAFPGHIYLSSEVNAFVFFNSSFWSMVFPVRKNLVIGLGLVNMTNLSEFKSVIAHEFGHFSQKSMRAGSYVYHANKVLYNMLYENSGYQSILQRWANIHGIFSFCVAITVRIVHSIQWILQQAYKVVNKQYLSLSRQMEFHADAMSAKTAGSNNAIHALRRLEFADASYHAVIAKYNQWLPLSLKGENLYSQQRIVAKFIAADYDLQLSVAGLPLMDDVDKHYKNYSKVQIGNQWASHPSREQREAALNALGVTGMVVEEPVWSLFPNAHELQQLFTKQLYRKVTFEQDEITLQDELFATKYAAENASNRYPVFYESYYNGRSITEFPLNDSMMMTSSITSIKTFFKENEDLHTRIEATKADIQLLEQITDKKNEIRTFDYDGNRYKRKNAPEIKTELEQESEALSKRLAQKDEAVYHYYYCKAKEYDEIAAARLKQQYKEYFQLQKIVADNIALCRNISEQMQPFSGSMTLEQATQLSQQLAESVGYFTSRVDRVAAEIASAESLKTFPLPETLAGLKTQYWQFINAQHKVVTDRLDELWNYLQQFADWSYRTSFEVQKKVLQEQLDTETPTGKK